MLLGITTKDEVLANAKKTYLIGEKALETYQDFLKLNNPDLQAFIKCIFPQMTFSNAFGYKAFKSSLLGGTFEDIFYSQTDSIPLACPEIINCQKILIGKLLTLTILKLLKSKLCKN